VDERNSAERAESNNESRAYGLLGNWCMCVWR
jgi:hypothetical protein